MITLNFIQLQTVLFILCLIQKVQTNNNQKQCQTVLLKQNEKYCELREINTFFVGQRSDNLTNINTLQSYEDLIQISNGPILYSKDDIIISIKYRELIDENEICSLIYNPQLNTYSINCISTQQTYIIDNQIIIQINTQFNILIQTEQNFNCSQFDYNTIGLAIFCFSSDQIKLYQLQKEQEQFKQTIIYQSEILNLLCLLKFHYYSNIFFIIYFSCQGWIIHVYENNSFKLQIDQNLLIEKYNTEGILLDVLTCQHNIFMLLSSGGYYYSKEQLILLFKAENLNLKEIVFEFDFHCNLRTAVKSQSENYVIYSLPKQFQEIILNTKELPKKVFQISNPTSILLKYENYVSFYVNELVYQTITIKIAHLIQLSNQRIYIGIGEENQVKLFQIKYSKPCLPYYNDNQKYSNYYLQFIDKLNLNFQKISFIECYKPIIMDNDDMKKEYAIFINIQNKIYYIERINYEESFQVSFLASSIQSIQPYKINFRSPLNQIKFQLKNNQIKCIFNHQLKNYKGKFIIKTKNDLIFSIIVQGPKNNIIEYHCQSSQDYIYQNILPLNEQLLHKFINSNNLILLDQQKMCLYKIQLDEQNQNELISKILCLDSQVEKIFGLNNQIIFKLKDQPVFYNMFSNFGQIKIEQNFMLGQIKNQNFLDIFQIQIDFYGVLYIDQLHLIYKQVVVQIINIKAEILGFLSNSQSNLISSLVLIDIIKNELQFYVVSTTEFIKIRYYNLGNYVPVQPLQFKILESKIIISCQHKINKKFYILIINCAFQSSLHLLQKVIETSNQFFWVQRFYLYYFDNKNELSVQDLLHINIEIQYLEFDNKISQEIIIQIEIELENIEIPPFKKDIMITLINPKILKLIQTDYILLINNNNQEVNFRNFILGEIDNIILKSNDEFQLRYPLEKEMDQICQYYCNKFCFQVNNFEYMTFFKFGLFEKTYLVYNFQKQIYNLLFVEIIKQDLFLFINQINNQTILISLIQIKDNFFIIQKQLNTQIFNNLKNI
ncbi:unnamed protein product [Paramecium pentaurelia]|uniref:Transmembrane protein n=1 Tax=Paramecium pentaurelia TaxID=43138 RepID=A0A8S1TU99_9CILI|nr:unnamed protein product [Paramecium pentaurelia]